MSGHKRGHMVCPPLLERAFILSEFSAGYDNKRIRAMEQLYRAVYSTLNGPDALIDPCLLTLIEAHNEFCRQMDQAKNECVGDAGALPTESIYKRAVGHD